MTPDQARTILEASLREIVPDADLSAVAGDTDLRDWYELDSLDFVELVEQLSTRAGFRIEDSDAEELRTPDRAAAFLVRRDSVARH